MIAALLAWLFMSNPYLDRVEDLPNGFINRGCKVGMEMPPEVLSTWSELTYQYSWAIPTKEAIEAIAAWGPLVDFGAGSGYWTYLLTRMGANVIAIDDWSWGRPELWSPVVTGGTELLDAYQHHTLLLVWPPRDRMPLEALQAWDGDRLVYVGELRRGSGDAEFWDEIDRHWTLDRRIDIPNWWTRSDEVYLLKRRNHGDSAKVGEFWTQAEVKQTCDMS